MEYFVVNVYVNMSLLTFVLMVISDVAGSGFVFLVCLKSCLV